MSSFTIEHTAKERFLKYVKFDTQSDPDSDTCPSTDKQKDLGAYLVNELQEMGVSDAHMDEHGYVYATIEGNSDKKVPVICVCAHMDTSPDCSGANVNPVIHENYDGTDIVLPNDTAQIIKTGDHPDLLNQKGNDVITADGTTLLGADNKAGIAAIMDATNFYITHPEVKHGTIRILFTPDEEIGRGADKVDIEKLGAEFGYTIDGDSLGCLEDETFSADGATITVHGVSAHPGFAKGKLESAIKMASEIIDQLPKDKLSPETTEGREGFIHPLTINGMVEKVVIKFIIRDFTEEGLKKLESYLEDVAKKVANNYKGSSVDFEVEEQYRNMKIILDKHPEVIEHAKEAMKRAGIDYFMKSVRGGTDGSKLSFMGLPTPNIFAGEHAFHSKMEWISAQDLAKSAETIINLGIVWEEHA